jgi:PKD repeat protein
VNATPVAALAADPAAGPAPLTVTLNAAASSDSDGTITSYRFDFGDGAVEGPQAEPTASHTYAPGTWKPTVTVTDDAGGSAAATLTLVSLSDNGEPPVVVADSVVTVAEATPLTLTVHVSDPDGDAIAALSAQLTGLPAGNHAVFTAAPGDTTGTLTWTPTYADSGRYIVTFVASNERQGTASTVIMVSNVDRAPSVTAPASLNAVAAAPLAITVTAADADGDSIAALGVELATLPPGNDAAFVAGAGDTIGTLHWTPTAADTGTFVVTFTAANADSGSASTTISVRPANQLPAAVLVATPVTGNAPLAVVAHASGSSDADGTIVSYRFDFGDGSVAGPQADPTASHVYAAGSFTLSVTVTDDNGGESVATAPIIAAASGSEPNLVLNPSFEASTSGWSSYGGATLQRVPGGFVGAWALKVSGADTLLAFGATDSPNWVGVTPQEGTHYRISAWVRSASAAGDARLRIREYLGGVRIGAAGYFSNTARLSPTWQLLQLDYVCQRQGSTLDLQVEDVPLVAREEFEVDNVSIRIVTGAAPGRAGEPRDAGQSACTASAEEPLLDLGAGESTWKVRFGPSRDSDGKPERYSRLTLQYREGEAAACLVAVAPDGGWGPLEVWFDRTVLRKLFAGLAPGRQTVIATVVGECPDGTTRAAPLTFDVAGAPAPLRPIVTPNPMRGSGVIGFATSSRGLLQAEIFDATGRRVRRLAPRAESAAGWHDLTLDGRDDTGAVLAAGIYFYRIVSVDGVANGRLVFLR